MANFTIEELPIPATLDDETAPDFIRMIELAGVVDALSYGTNDLFYEPSEELPHHNDKFAPHRVFLARVNGTIVGRAVYEGELDEENDSAWASVSVLPEFRGQGIGRALADQIEQVARDLGKAKLLSYVGLQDAPGETLVAPTGFGAIPAEDRGVRFLLARGYTFEQVERMSRLPLPVENIDELWSPLRRRRVLTTEYTLGRAQPLNAGSRASHCSIPA